ncbi:MAG: prepilin-type N-terminal cleavage/methylation domain-containing protein [Phycisphaerae bacterium]
MRQSSTGFTLIELLVVVAIIGLLISILLPSLAGARQAARTAVCASNLHNVGIGCTIYADANRGVLVPGRPGKFLNAAQNIYWVGNGYHFRPRWFVRMGAESGFFAFEQPSTNPADDNTKLIDGNKVFLCPEVLDRQNNRNYAYGYNYQFLGNTRFRGGVETNGFIHFPVKIESIRAAGTVMAADAMGTAAGKPAAARTDYRNDGVSDLFAIGNHAWSLDPPRLTPLGDFCDDNNRAPQHRSAPEMRHRESANVLWVDGHVSRGSYVNLGYVVNPDGSIADMGPQATNHLFDGTGRDDDPPVIN